MRGGLQDPPLFLHIKLEEGGPQRQKEVGRLFLPAYGWRERQGGSQVLDAGSRNC